MSLMATPAKLPFAPRPYSTELLSSWLLRVAAANMVSLRELLDGFESRYGEILSNDPIDYGIPHEAVAALAQFCRVTPARVRALDLRERASHLNPALLLRFHTTSLVWYPRCCLRRVRYAFCPLCLARQRHIYARWDWSVACLIRCVAHRTTLLDGCPACGEPDPLTFSGFDSPPAAVCHACGADLTANPNNAEDPQRRSDILAVESAYRAMLLGIAPDPTLLGRATHEAFRQFVEDMLHLLILNLTASAVRFSMRDILQIITALIENAAPSTDKRTRCRRYSRGLNLWATLLRIIPELQGDTFERSSRRWPASLQRRFLSARYYAVNKRFPYSPYGSTYGQRIEHRKIAAMYGLLSPVQAPIQTVATGLWHS